MQEHHEILLLGPELAGKSQLINRLKGNPFNPQIKSTATVQSVAHKLSERLKIIYRDVPPDTDQIAFKRYFGTANQIYLVFNASALNGLEDLKNLIQDFQFNEEAVTTLIATHADVGENGIDQNVENAAKVYAAELGAEYCPISLADENHPSLEILRKKSTRLPTRASQPQRSVHGGSCLDDQSHYDESASHYGLSSYALQRRDALVAAQDTKSHDRDKFTRTMSAHDSQGSQIRSESHSSRILNQRHATRQSMSTANIAHNTTRRDKHPESFQTQSATLNPPAPPPAHASGYSFALRMAGIAMILTAVIGLIYIALVVVNIVSAAALISLMNHIVVGIGGLLGASTSTSLMTIAASLNLSTTAAAGMLLAGPSLAVLAIGFGVFRAGQKAAANTQAVETLMLGVS